MAAAYKRVQAVQNVKLRVNVSSLRSHVDAEGVVKWQPFNQKQEDHFIDDNCVLYNNPIFVTSIDCVHTSATIPFDVFVTAFGTRFLVSTGEMQRNGVANSIHLQSHNPCVDIDVSKLCGAGVKDPHTIQKWIHDEGTQVFATEMLGFAVDKLTPFCVPHGQRSIDCVVFSADSPWIDTVYRVTALQLIEAGADDCRISDVLCDRSSTHWFVPTGVLAAAAERMMDMQRSIKRMYLPEETFTFTRADGNDIASGLDDAAYVGTLTVTLGLQITAFVAPLLP